MNGQFTGKVAIITGGASGIGRASVLRFLAAGASVVIADLNQKTGEETLDLARQAGHAQRVRFHRCDVAAEREVEETVSFAVAQFGRLDCMFNNAGLGGAFGAIVDTKVEEWDRTFAVLVRGVFLGTKHAARAIALHGQGGTIIQTASVAGLTAGAGAPAYSSSKAAVINFTRFAAVELAPQKIRVNAICPGAIFTPLVHRGHDAGLATVLQQAQPWPEAGLPEYIADVAVFLASDQSHFITGEYIVADGGLMAAGPRFYDGGNPAGNAIVERVAQAMNLPHVHGAMESIPAGFDSGNTGVKQ